MESCVSKLRILTNVIKKTQTHLEGNGFGFNEQQIRGSKKELILVDNCLSD
jgi:hypothetical protein